MLLALAGCVGSGVAAEPQFQCASVLPSATRTPAYARIGSEARCEGYFEQTVSQPFIELLSLTRQRPDAAPSGVATTQIRARPDVAAQLLIQPLAPSPFYRVDAALTPGQTLAWDPKPMLQSTGLRPADLGLLARTRLTDPGPQAVVPVSLTPGVDEPIAYAVLRVSVAVSAMASRSYPLPLNEAEPSAWRALPGTPLYAWQTIVLPVELAADGHDRGIDVRAIGKDGQPLPLLQFIVVGK
jgi:hypothetical protein